MNNRNIIYMEKVLDKDLPRTFANLGFFHRGGVIR